MDTDALAAANAARWSKARMTREAELMAGARTLLASKARYQAVEAKAGVPWFVIAVIHMRESSGSFAGILHNGERIIGTGRLTSLVPKARGPFATWEDAAVDALQNNPPYVAQNADWSPGGTLTILERYNGLGYANQGLPSPYLWSGTDQYERGKYVADGKFDPNAVDQQLGCAGLLLSMARLDASVQVGVVLGAQLPAPAAPSPSPSLWAAFAAFLAKLFGGKAA